MFFALSVTTRILTAVGEAAISATCYPLAIYQFSKQNEGKALVRNNAGKQVILGGGGEFQPLQKVTLYITYV